MPLPPALCANGLLSGIGKYLKLPAGFYSCLHILLTLGFMALGRIRRPEGLRHVPPGELGKVIGLDRVPEARTLRAKITAMANNGNPEAWMKELSKTRMGSNPEEAGYLYIDGHVRVYNGDKAVLPCRYVSRERLCLRGTMDYWVNDALGRPFFVVTKAVTEGLADTLLKDMVPDLPATVPGQPTEAELTADPTLHRFVVVFDREGATHSLLSALWEKQIGAITYRKNVRDVWLESEFLETEVPVQGGGSTRMKLARRETALTAGKAAITVVDHRVSTRLDWLRAAFDKEFRGLAVLSVSGGCMLSPHDSRESLSDLFARRRIVDIKLLFDSLRTGSRMSVFRRLSDLGYLTSYSHTGRYYTLVDVPDFDADGLWQYQGVLFSRRGSLKPTVEHLVRSSETGRTHEELHLRLRVRVHNALLYLVRQGRIARATLGTMYLYVSGDSETAAKQMTRRRSGRKILTVDFYVKWRISDVGQYYRATGGIDDKGSTRLAEIVTVVRSPNIDWAMLALSVLES